MADPHRLHWAGLIAATAAVIAGAFVLPLVVGRPDIQENRALAPPPAPPRGLADLTTFRKAADPWVADHFPPRTQLIGALNALRLRLGVSGSNRVIVGQEGWLFYDDGSHMGAARGEPALSDGAAQAWLEALAGRTEALRAEGRTYVVLTPPLKETLYPEYGPAWFRPDPNRAAMRLSRLARLSGAGDVIYPHAEIDHQTRWGVKTYSRHDTHWTDLGAYYGYVAFMRHLQAKGLTEGPRGPEHFALRAARGEGGEPRDLALMLGVASFIDVDYPQLQDTTPTQGLKITYLGPRLDWTDLRLIETGEIGKPTLLMTVDSFSNAMLPFLYPHFSRIVLAHNQDGAWRPDLIARFQPDIVALEVLEGGLTAVMGDAPAASPEARERISRRIADRRSYMQYPTATPPPGQDPVKPGKGRVKQGGPGNDVIDGTPWSDVLHGRQGADRLRGLAGNDTLLGGQGPDAIDGGDGGDFISGGRGDDRLRGGKGGDIFSVDAGAGEDQLLDFNAGDGDQVQIAAGVTYVATQVGPDTVVAFQGGRLILRGVKLADLPRGWIRNP